jgi:hypothetical protein
LIDGDERIGDALQDGACLLAGLADLGPLLLADGARFRTPSGLAQVPFTPQRWVPDCLEF